MELKFPKTGQEIKEAIQKRKFQLQERLDRRNMELDRFLQDQQKVRSYILRTAGRSIHMSRSKSSLMGEGEISVEEQEEVQQLCLRIYGIKQELHRLSLIEAHLKDSQQVELELDDLMAYGFSAEGIISAETP